MPVNSLAWSPDSTLFVSGSLDKHAIVWDAATCTAVHWLQGHEGFLKGVAWDPVGSYVATMAEDQNVHIWATRDWTPVDSIAAPLTHMSSNLMFCRCGHLTCAVLACNKHSPAHDRTVAVVTAGQLACRCLCAECSTSSITASQVRPHILPTGALPPVPPARPAQLQLHHNSVTTQACLRAARRPARGRRRCRRQRRQPDGSPLRARALGGLGQAPRRPRRGDRRRRVLPPRLRRGQLC